MDDDGGGDGDARDDESLGEGENSGILSRMALNDNKAGMQGLDKDKINRIILENSVGSKFYENEKKKDAQVDARISKLLDQVQKITPEQLDVAFGQTNAILKELERGRDLTKTIVHIDMDAFYASVEERDNPELKEKPMAVGGMGMLSTSNYVARRYGVRAAMPGFIGKKLCPDLILVPLNFPKYKEVSQQVREILATYDPNFLPIGLDEAYVDMTEHLKDRKRVPEANRTFSTHSDENGTTNREGKIVFGLSAEEAVNEMRFKIEQKTKLTASAGIAPNTLLAKVASDMNKPNGQFFLEPTRDSVMKFVNKLPIRKVSGIGKVAEKLLNAIGIKTCQDLYEQRAILYAVFSQTMSGYFLRTCIGIGSTVLETGSERKSISIERTFGNISNPEEMYKKCEELCEALESDAKKAEVQGMTVTLKIKTSSFELHTRSKTLFHPVNCKSEVYPIVADLLRQELAAKNGFLKLRLIGVGLSKLSKSDGVRQQKSLDFFLQKATLAAKKNEFSDYNGNGDDLLECSEAISEANEETVGKKNTIVSGEESKITDSESSFLDQVEGKKDQDVCDAESNCDFANAAKYSCPVCSAELYNLYALNSHVDECASQEKPNVSKTKQSAHLGIRVSENNNAVSDKMLCLTCPICNATFCCQDMTLDKFNAHVDSCLNRKTVMELVKSESQIYSRESPSSKTTAKRVGSTSGLPKKKRKKTDRPSCTLDRFFK